MIVGEFKDDKKHGIGNYLSGSMNAVFLFFSFLFDSFFSLQF